MLSHMHACLMLQLSLLKLFVATHDVTLCVMCEMLLVLSAGQACLCKAAHVVFTRRTAVMLSYDGIAG